MDSIYVEVSKTDAALDGVYFKPVAYRVAYDFTTEDWKYSEVSDFTTEITNAGITKLPLGTAQVSDTLYAMARLGLDATKKPSTFGHNIVKRDSTGKPTAGVDAYFGAVLLGLQFIEGDNDKIAAIWKSNIAVHLSAKLLTFEGSTQVG